jgi:hypothetical protein
LKLDSIGELYHTGTMVADLEAAMAQTGPSLGVEWIEPIRSRTEVWTPTGRRRLSLMWTYSVGGSHRIELIQQLDEADESARLDMPREPHFGYWVKDADKARARLEAAGFEIYFARMSAEEETTETTLVSYHQSPAGFFVELVSERARPALQALLDGGTTWDGIG